MLEVYLKFGGKIIEELLQKILLMLFVFNELIKNVYDVFLLDVIIKVNLLKGIVIIFDNGNGMGVDEIGSFFYILQSFKRYGYVIEQDGVNRII